MLKKLALLSTVSIMSLGSFVPTFAASVEEVAPRIIKIDLENIDYLTENEENSSVRSSKYVPGNEKVEEVEFRDISYDEENADYLTEDTEITRASKETFDWSKGEYSFHAEFSKSVSTKVQFTGSSKYYVNIMEAWEFKDGKNQYDKSNVAFVVNCYDAKTGTIVSSHSVSGTGSKSLCFSGLDSKKSYYFVFAKNKVVMGDDDSVEVYTSGTISLE